MPQGETDRADRGGRGVSLEALASRAERAGVGAPPVERWNPAHCGEIDMLVDADGRWFHEGAPIEREALVRLFSSILRREADGSFVLVTPAEKMTIRVEDAPFVAVELSVAGEGASQVVSFRTNVGDLVAAGPDHPLRFAEGGEGFRPYLTVRGGLEARLTRSLAYDLAGLVEETAEGLRLRSNGASFAVPAASGA